MSQERIFVWILLVNTIIAALYFLVACLIAAPFTRRRANGKIPLTDNRRSCFIRFLVILLCPVAGIVYFSLGQLFSLVFFRGKAAPDDAVFAKERVEIRTVADEESERNIVPLEEGLAVSGKKELRSLMLSIVKENARNSLGPISRALASDDSETACYAACVMQDALRDFRLHVQETRQRLEDLREKKKLAERDEQANRGDPEARENQRENAQLILDYELQLFEYMNPILSQRVFQEIEQNQFVKILEEDANDIYAEDPALLTAQQYEELTRRMVEVERYDDAELWCARLALAYPDRLESFSARLRLEFQSGRWEDFMRTAARLKRSGVVFDSRTLELIKLLDIPPGAYI